MVATYVLYKLPVDGIDLIEAAATDLIAQYRDTGHLDQEQLDWLDFADQMLTKDRT